MRRRRRARADTYARTLGIGSIIVLMVAGALLVEPEVRERSEPPPHPPPLRLAPADPPIPAEAGVFRTHPTDVAAAPTAAPRAGAQRRTLAIHRSLRAFPGAPPRIPHGLTDEEFRDGRCSTCHERGGYVARFAAYAPVTPHPEFTQCLQCHVPDARKVGIGLPAPVSPVVCRQCHVAPEAPRPQFVPLDWPAPQWPRLRQPAVEGSPPVIPHDLQLRGNCLACHAGPGAVAEIRVRHPERTNCRQCHVTTAADAGAFLPAAPAGGGDGG